MKNIVYLFGNSGMLGHKLHQILTENNFDVYSIGKSQAKLVITLPNDFNALFKLPFIKGSYLVNCIGLIPQKTQDHSYDTYAPLNRDLPLLISKLCEQKELKFIHISSDCVFAGNKGNYCEGDHDINHNDNYARSKIYADIALNNALILRTSIIGPELNSHVGLYEWFRNTEINPIKGYINWYWNGLTTKEFSKVILKIIKDDLYTERQLCHIYSPNIMSKYQLLEEFNKKLGLNKTIEPTLLEKPINRSVNSLWPDFNEQFKIQDLYTQIKEI